MIELVNECQIWLKQRFNHNEHDASQLNRCDENKLNSFSTYFPLIFSFLLSCSSIFFCNISVIIISSSINMQQFFYSSPGLHLLFHMLQAHGHRECMNEYLLMNQLVGICKLFAYICFCFLHFGSFGWYFVGVVIHAVLSYTHISKRAHRLGWYLDHN